LALPVSRSLVGSGERRGHCVGCHVTLTGEASLLRFQLQPIGIRQRKKGKGFQITGGCSYGMRAQLGMGRRGDARGSESQERW